MYREIEPPPAASLRGFSRATPVRSERPNGDNKLDAFILRLFEAPATGWGAFGSLSIFIVVSVIRGWLIPRVTHEREVARSDKRGDEWKESCLEARVTIGQLITTNEIVNDFFKKVPVKRAEQAAISEEVT